MARSAHDAFWPVDSWTSDVIARDWDTFSKIRARLCLRLRLLYTTHAVGSRESRRCEQEVVPQKVGHTTRLDPVGVAGLDDGSNASICAARARFSSSI